MTPLYLHVKSSLRARILSGEYKPGQKIPTEAELVREFGVSAITIRRALRDLRVEGQLFGRQGLGVFVNNQPRVSRSLNPNYSASLGDEIRRAGFVPSLTELGFKLTSPDPAIAAALKISPQSIACQHEKLILADGRPICLDILIMPRKLGQLLRTGLQTEFVLPLLKKHHIQHKSIDYRIEATAATEREAPLVELHVGAPLLSVRYFPVSPIGHRIFAGHMLARPEWFAFEFGVPARNKSKK